MSLKYYTPKYFAPEELVPPLVYDALRDKSLLVMDYRILKTADALREFFGSPITINDWKIGGVRKESGFRSPDTRTGSAWSQHKFGRAIDCLIGGIDAETARKMVLENSKHFPYITCIEDNVSWLHVDCRAINNEGIQVIGP